MLSAPETCSHGCVGWCAACDWETSHPEGWPEVVELPGRAAVTCPRKGCGHPLSAHKDALCTVGRCWCGLPGAREATGDDVDDTFAPPTMNRSLQNLVCGIAAEVEDEQPTIALMLRRALAVTKGRSW